MKPIVANSRQLFDNSNNFVLLSAKFIRNQSDKLPPNFDYLQIQCTKYVCQKKCQNQDHCLEHGVKFRCCSVIPIIESTGDLLLTRFPLRL